MDNNKQPSEQDPAGSRIVGVWNTSITMFANDLKNPQRPIHVVDAEDRRYTLTLQPGESWKPSENDPIWVVIPWCDSVEEVNEKAIRIHFGTDASGPIQAYIFQHYTTSLIQTMDATRTEFPGAPAFPFPATTMDIDIWDPPPPGNSIVWAVGYRPFGPMGGYAN
jgi:hypothetical protein